MSLPSSKRSIFTSFLLHIHPRTIPASSLNFTLSFGLGGMAVTLFCLLGFTGLLQLVSYSPHSTSAYSSILRLYDAGNIGGYVRNLHAWSGNLLVVVACLHLLRVFFTGALENKRRLNWLLGLFLLFLVLFSNFTGYLLPWDQVAYWAVTIFTNMLSYLPFIGEPLAILVRGGAEVGEITLRIFYSLHVTVLPLFTVFLLAIHFWTVRKAGGLVQSGIEISDRIPVNPNLIVREIATGTGLVAILCLFAAFVDVPLADPANASFSPNPAKAAWYFMGLQELLLHLHPTVSICVIPLVMVFGMAAIPYIKDGVLPGGQWFGGVRGGRLAVSMLLITSVLTVLIVIWDEKQLRDVSNIVGENLLIIRGLMPLGIVFAVGLLVYLGLTRIMSYSRAQAIMALVVANISIIITLTGIGVWFRGGGMALVSPF